MSSERGQMKEEDGSAETALVLKILLGVNYVSDVDGGQVHFPGETSARIRATNGKITQVNEASPCGSSFAKCPKQRRYSEIFLQQTSSFSLFA